MIFTTSKDFVIDKEYKFVDGVMHVANDKYDKMKKKLSKFNPDFPIRGNDGLIVNKKKRGTNETKRIQKRKKTDNKLG